MNTPRDTEDSSGTDGERSPIAPAVPIIVGRVESVCGVLDRIERRWPEIDYVTVRNDLTVARARIDELLARIARRPR